jgi:hypothetical protein
MSEIRGTAFDCMSVVSNATVVEAGKQGWGAEVAAGEAQD